MEIPVYVGCVGGNCIEFHGQRLIQVERMAKWVHSDIQVELERVPSETSLSRRLRNYEDQTDYGWLENTH